MAVENEQDRDDLEQKEQERLEAAEKAEADKQEAERLKKEKAAETETFTAEDIAEKEAELERMRKYLSKGNKEAEKYRLEAKAYRELGVEPDEIKKLIQEREEAEIKDAEKRQDYEALREKEREKHAKELARRDDIVTEKEQDLSNMQKTLENYLIDAQLTAEIANAGAKPKLLMPHVRNKAKVVRTEDGKYNVGVLDDDGNIRDNFSLKDLVEESKKDDDLSALFPAPESSGAATNQQGQKSPGAKGKAPKKKKSEMTDKERESFIGEFGVAEYKKLPI